MEFRFDLRPMFSQPIVKVTANMLPHTFRGDRRSVLDTTTKVTEIINAIGEYSAKAQGLNKAITTAQKLRQSDHIIYLLVDTEDGKNGSVIGMLKIGKKTLYVFDEHGQTKMVENARCILDFYIHESRQRAGLGKDLFDAMLKEEQWDPIKLATDRPSDKLLGFLKKHYGLNDTIPQMNNFVIYKGFFGDSQQNGCGINNNNYQPQQIHITSSPNTALFGPLISSSETKSSDNKSSNKGKSSNMVRVIGNNPIGRYAAGRPICSMAEPQPVLRVSLLRQKPEKRSGLQEIRIVNDSNLNICTCSKKMQASKNLIIHSSAKQTSNEPNSPGHDDDGDFKSEIESVIENIEESLIIDDPVEEETSDDVIDNADINNDDMIEQNENESINQDENEAELLEEKLSNGKKAERPRAGKATVYNENVWETNYPDSDNPIQSTKYRSSKKHAGYKNISSGVSASFGSQEPNDDTASIHSKQDTVSVHEDDNLSVRSSTDENRFTGKVCYDLKNHHNKLW